MQSDPGRVITPRPEWVPAWDSLSADQKKLYLRLFENFAGYLAFTDHECGRLIDAVNQLPDADNTMIIYIVGDNGASSEGGPDGTLNEVKALNGFPTPLEDNLSASKPLVALKANRTIPWVGPGPATHRSSG